VRQRPPAQLCATAVNSAGHNRAADRCARSPLRNRPKRPNGPIPGAGTRPGGKGQWAAPAVGGCTAQLRGRSRCHWPGWTFGTVFRRGASPSEQKCASPGEQPLLLAAPSRAAPAGVASHHRQPLPLRHREDAQVERPGELLLVQRPLDLTPHRLVLRRAHPELPRRDEGQAHADGIDHLRHHRPHPGVEQLRHPVLQAGPLAGLPHHRQRPQQPHQAGQLGPLALAVVIEPVGQGQPGRLVRGVGVQRLQERGFHRGRSGLSP
jgi:hypothetical protein